MSPSKKQVGMKVKVLDAPDKVDPLKGMADAEAKQAFRYYYAHRSK